jgi:hypothetical protein
MINSVCEVTRTGIVANGVSEISITQPQNSREIRRLGNISNTKRKKEKGKKKLIPQILDSLF